MKVLFVCSGNAHRSPLAEALLRKLRPDLEIDSAGITTVIPISAKVREYLEKKHAGDYLKRKPENLETKKIGDYDVIIAMQQKHKDAILAKCPECRSRIVLWDIEDPYYMKCEEAEKVYAQIEEKVKQLAKSI
jgi:protein-tyrosine phosphatase